MFIKKLKIVLIQAFKLLLAIIGIIFGFILIIYPIGLQMQYDKEGVWGYLVFIPIGITLLFILLSVIDWEEIGTFQKWDVIKIKNNKKITL